MNETVMEAIRELILSEFDTIKDELRELREEFKDFKAEVRAQLEAFKLTIGINSAINSINKRLDSTENRFSNIENDVRNLTLRIDAVKEELTARMNEIKGEPDPEKVLWALYKALST